MKSPTEGYVFGGVCSSLFAYSWNDHHLEYHFPLEQKIVPVSLNHKSSTLTCVMTYMKQI